MMLLDRKEFRKEKMKHNILIYFALFFLVTLINSCAIYSSTTYSQIPKPIRKTIERNYQNDNAFFYKLFDKSNTFLFWRYEQSTVKWFSYTNGKISNQGTFESNNGAHGLTVSQTTYLLKIELDKFEKACFFALDGECFGYVIDNCEFVNFCQEFVGIMYISTPQCFDNLGINNFIANDFKKIRDLNYTLRQ